MSVFPLSIAIHLNSYIETSFVRQAPVWADKCCTIFFLTDMWLDMIFLTPWLLFETALFTTPFQWRAPVNDALVLGFVMQEPGRELNVLGVCLAAWR